MEFKNEPIAERGRHLIPLTRDWGDWERVSLYLDRCQVDTPNGLVEAAWAHVKSLRNKVGKVVDFGAGDGRFAQFGDYGEYIGYEIDKDRCLNFNCSPNAILINKCAFSDSISNADLCIGNPPFVRNQDLPVGWRQRVSSVLKERAGISISGLANAWQYFFLLGLLSVKSNGLVALVIPYEWVSRPSVKPLRDYITSQKWDVSVYRLVDNTFDSVLTTSSITIVDKASKSGKWSYFEETAAGHYLPLQSASGSTDGVIRYLKRSEISKIAPRAVRGVSPGTQKVLTLTEGERVRYGLSVGRDVVPCVTTLRHLPHDVKELSEDIFRTHFRMEGQKCWLIKTDKAPSKRLRSYLSSVEESEYQTSTCLERDLWWKFQMPKVPNVLMAMSFRGKFPKAVLNSIDARAVGGVCGVYNTNEGQSDCLAGGLDGIDITGRIVAHSNGMRKIEINQINALLAATFSDVGDVQ
jgi:hypothetical protein